MDVIGALLWWVLAAAAALLLHRWEPASVIAMRAKTAIWCLAVGGLLFWGYAIAG